MKYILSLCLVLCLSACSLSEMRSTQGSTVPVVNSGAKTDPYEIGSVDTAFKLL